MTDRAIVVATLTAEPPAELLDELAGVAEVLEVRADLAGELDPSVLRRAFSGRLLYTLRSGAEGGEGPDEPERRGRRLAAAAAAGYDLVDYEVRRDLEHCGAAPDKRILSWHGRARDFRALGAIAAEMTATPAALYKIVPHATRHGDEVVPLALLASLGRTDVMAFATGLIGTWSRLVAPRLGAPWIFGSAGNEPAAPGQLAVERLVRDYGLPDLRPARELFGVAGRPVLDSLSPRLHNEAYRDTGTEALYVPFHVESFGDFWLEVVESGSLNELGLPLGGLSVTAPAKRIALALAGAASPLAIRVGSANTLVRRDGVWEAETTDGEGSVGPLASREIALNGCRAAVLGAGGAGRAAAFALSQAGAEVCLFNRTEENLAKAVRELKLEGRPWDELVVGDWDLLVHATPLGRLDGDPLPFDPAQLSPGAVVEDLAYLPDGPTALVKATRAAGRVAVDGREVLLYQAVPQFEVMTGREMPLELARRLLEIRDVE